MTRGVSEPWQEAAPGTVDTSALLSQLAERARGVTTAERLMTADELAARLGATPRFIRRLVAERRIAYVKCGRLVRFEEAAVVAFIERNRVPPMTRAELRRPVGSVA
jgi:excisionase family DNA binding protein